MTVNTKHPVYVLIFAAAVSAAFTAAIMALQAVTAGTVARNEKLFEQKALVDVFRRPLGIDRMRNVSDEKISQLYSQHIRRLEVELIDPVSGTVFNRAGGAENRGGKSYKLVVRKDGRDALAGYAFPIMGVGFWARIDGYLAVTPDAGKIIGIAFTKHQETPGLGGRISEPAWRDKFSRPGKELNITPPRAGGQYVYIGGEEAGSSISPRANRRVDAITGATGTSIAVEAFLNKNIAQFRRAATAAGLLKPETSER